MASNVNFVAGQVVPNRVYVKLSATGAIDVFNYAGNADVVIDVGGYFGDGSGAKYYALAPARIVDTRPATQVGPFATPLRGGSVDVVNVAGHGGVPGSGVVAVVGDVAVTDTTQSSYLTVYPSDVARPLASDLNWAPGATVANLVVTKLATAGSVGVYDQSGQVDFVFDVAGYYGP
jgi:hypothetical protein